MRQQEVFNKIGGIIRELNEQYNYVELSGDLFNDLELELMAANAHFLSDHVEILRKINRNSKKPQLAASPQPISGKDEFLETVSPPERDSEGATTTIFEFDTKKSNPNEVNIVYEMEPEMIRHELIMDETRDDWDEEDNNGEASLQPEAVENIIILPEVITPIPEVFKPAPQLAASTPELFVPEPAVIPESKVILPEPVPAAEPKTVVYTPVKTEEAQVLTLNERMSARLASSKAEQLASPQPITDLKSAITLNDKLIFIKDLFHGYSLAYSEALDILNRMDTFDEAEKYLKGSYATKNSWADKQATADKFYALLQRRYL